MILLPVNITFCFQPLLQVIFWCLIFGLFPNNIVYTENGSCNIHFSLYYKTLK